jgi:hypothetical protein
MEINKKQEKVLTLSKTTIINKMKKNLIILIKRIKKFQNHRNLNLMKIINLTTTKGNYQHHKTNQSNNQVKL